jgi:hypothetical protein
VTEFLDVASAKPTSTNQGTIHSCEYAVAAGPPVAKLYLDVSTTRGPSIYTATQQSGGFTAVTGVGDQAAYNGEDGRFIVRDHDAFVLITVPVALASSSVASPAEATKVASAMANRVLQALR